MTAAEGDSVGDREGISRTVVVDGEGEMAGAKYKDNKPEMEKKRRSRINESLSCLKLLVLGEVRRKNTRISKLDKADILEMAVEYVQRMNIPSHVVATRVDKYRAGFNACAEEVRKHLAQTPDVDIDVRTRVVDHLANFVQNLQWLRRHDILPLDVASRHDVTAQNDFMSQSVASRHNVIPSDVMYSRLQHDVKSTTYVRGGSTSESTSPDELEGHTRHRETNCHRPANSFSEKDLCQGHSGIHVRSLDYSCVKGSPSVEERLHRLTSYVDNCPNAYETCVNRSLDHSSETQKDHVNHSPEDCVPSTSNSASYGKCLVPSGGRPLALSDQIRFENRNNCLSNHGISKPGKLDANGNLNCVKVDNNNEHSLVRNTDGGRIMGGDGQERQGIIGHGGEANLLDNQNVWRPW